MHKPSIRTKAEAFYNLLGGKLRFISGKWFFESEEIKEPKKYWLTLNHNIQSMTELNECMDMYVGLYGESGLWFPLPIIDAAKEQKDLKPLCFPLNAQQLKIINRLLSGEDEICFICTGIGGSGKSTFLNIIKQIFDNDVSACPLSELSGYQLAEAVRHRLIASDELSADDLDNRSLKTIISKQKIQVNPKFEKPYQVQCQSSLFYCCNHPPRIDIDDSGILRRIIYYEMNTKIQNPDTSLNRREWSHADLVNIVKWAFCQDMTDWQKDFQADTRKYLTKNNTVYIFRNAGSYMEYKYSCQDAGLRPFSEPRYQDILDLLIEWGM